jgi:hypothetical protein
MTRVRRTMVTMDAFQELGITAVAEEPRPRTKALNVSELLTTVVAGTAATAGVIFGLIAIIAIVVSVYGYIQLQH